MKHTLQKIGVTLIVVLCTCRLGALFFIIMNQVFGNLSAINLFIKEKALFV